MGRLENLEARLRALEARSPQGRSTTGDTPITSTSHTTIDQLSDMYLDVGWYFFRGCIICSLSDTTATFKTRFGGAVASSGTRIAYYVVADTTSGGFECSGHVDDFNGDMGSHTAQAGDWLYQHFWGPVNIVTAGTLLTRVGLGTAGHNCSCLAGSSIEVRPQAAWGGG